MTHENYIVIREVNEELRSDQIKGVWSRYGKLIIAAAVLIVISTAGYRGYEYWQTHNASQSGDRFLAALKLAGENKHDEALAALQALEQEGTGGYPVLARMRSAALLAEMGDTAGAIAAFSAVGKESSAPEAMRDVARLRAARSEEHTSELQSLMRISYAVFCLKTHNNKHHMIHNNRPQKTTHT